MKNIQVIDGAQNSAYDIFAVEDEGFSLIFPEDKDIEFVEDFFERVGKEVAGKILAKAWDNRIDKKIAKGIHGTLFFQLEFKKEFYPNKVETDIRINYRK